MNVDDVINIIEALSPLLVGLLTAVATLAGVRLNNKKQDGRALNESRSKLISSLFARVNELERVLIKLELTIKTKQDVQNARSESVDAVRKLSKEYDKSAIFFPQSISQIVESILFEASSLNADVLLGIKEKGQLQGEVTSTIKKIKVSKEELRTVFQTMMGIKK